jgi:phosphomannomutase
MSANGKMPGTASRLTEAQELLKKAGNLVNPTSGIANDFLNQYNEVLLLVENLPVLLPEMVEDLLAWRAKTYQEYFSASPLPGSALAIKIYNSLDRGFRKKFEAQIAKINKIAYKAIAVIGERHRDTEELNGEDIEHFCKHISKKLRAEIDKSNMLVNHGLCVPIETSQEMADRLMGV